MFDRTGPENPLETLCSIDAEVPAQTQRDGMFSLLVGAWFGSHDFRVYGTSRELSITLRSARLTVTCAKGRIPISPRHERIVHRRSVKVESAAESARGANAGAALSGQLPPDLGGIAAKATLGGDWSSSVSRKETGTGEYQVEFRDFWSASANSWRFLGLDAAGNVGALSGRKLGDDILCDVETANGEADVVLSLVIEPADVVVRETGKDRQRDLSGESGANRSAVLGLLCAKALRGAQPQPRPVRDGPFALARVGITCRPDGEAAP